MKKTILIIITSLFIAGCSSEAYEAPFKGNLEHVHGIGYVGNDNSLYFASHTGLKIYRNGEWVKTTKNLNDYMGFNATDDGFYTSGHPGVDSDLPNPLGIQHSVDGGQTLEAIKFEGETDFHTMAVGYNSHDIFLMNPERNSELEKGFYKNFDDGKSWEAVAAEGLEGETLSAALHPTDSDLVAMATSTGIYLSKDGGENFKLLTNPNSVGTAVFFNNQSLYYASVDKDPSLINYQIESGKEEPLTLPDLTEDAPVYIAQNPQDDQQFAIYTIKGQVYFSEDGTDTWTQIAEDGRVK